jgi:hypothetical protein
VEQSYLVRLQAEFFLFMLGLKTPQVIGVLVRVEGGGVAVQFRNISISLRFHWLEQKLLVFFSELDHILIRLHLHEAPLSIACQEIERVAECPDASDEALDVKFIPQSILGF